MEANKKSRVDWLLIVLGLLFVSASVVAFSNPLENLKVFAVLFAILAIARGIWLIINKSVFSVAIFSGVIDIILGIAILTNTVAGIIALTYIFAIWFLIDSVFRLITIKYSKALGKFYFVFALLVNIVGVIVSVMLFLHPITAALVLSYMIAFYLFIAGAECFVGAFQQDF